MKSIDLPPAYAQLLDAAYAGALEGTGWSPFLDKVTSALNGPAALRWAPLGDLKNGVFLGSTVEPVALETYGEHFNAIDPWTNQDAQGGHPARMVVDEEVAPMAQVETGEFYNDWLAPQGLRHAARCRIAASDGRAVDLLLLRGATYNPYGARERMLCEALLPHLARALEIGQRLSLASDVTDQLSIAFDGLGASVILVDHERRVRLASRSAERLFQEGDTLQLIGGRLSAAGFDGIQLAALIQAATGSGRRSRGRGGGLLRIQKPDGSTLSITVAPAPEARRPQALSGGPFSLLIVNTPVEAVAIPEAALRALYGLTPAEAALAQALCAGRSPPEHARARCVSLTTAKSHLAAIFHKTGVRRQTDLVARLLTDVALRMAAR